MSGFIGPAITANGLTFVPAATPLGQVPPGASGLYEVRSNGVLLLELDGGPIAFACSNDERGRPGGGPGFLVSVFAYGSQMRFMFGTATVTKRRLGLADKPALACWQFARAILDQATAPGVTACAA